MNMTLAQVAAIRGGMPAMRRQVTTMAGEVQPPVFGNNGATTPYVEETQLAEIAFAGHHGAVGRSVGVDNDAASRLVAATRRETAEFIGASADEYDTVFTRNATDSLNILSTGLDLSAGDVVIVTRMEHSSNFLPWDQLTSATVVEISVTRDGRVDMVEFRSAVEQAGNNLKVLSVAHAANLTSFLNPVAEMLEYARRVNSDVVAVLDACQTLAHLPISAQDWGFDFVVASGHKAYAPPAPGFIVGRKELMARLKPHQLGGGMARLAAPGELVQVASPYHLEAGSLNVPGIAALRAALRVLEKIGLERIDAYERALKRQFVERIVAANREGIEVFGGMGSLEDSLGIVLLHGEGVTAALGQELETLHGIYTRYGLACAHRYGIDILNGNSEELTGILRAGGCPSTGAFLRFSLGLFNTLEEVEYVADAILGPRYTRSQVLYLPREVESAKVEAMSDEFQRLGHLKEIAEAVTSLRPDITDVNSLNERLSRIFGIDISQEGVFDFCWENLRKQQKADSTFYIKVLLLMEYLTVQGYLNTFANRESYFFDFFKGLFVRLFEADPENYAEVINECLVEAEA
ncbi:MAG: aminotransferase class V-fold PLP-dependent enzyme [bacterium]